jgi:hemerythrin superfamily protein
MADQTPTTGASADAIELILADHRGVEQLFHQLNAATTPQTRLEIGDRIICELSIHAAAEEQILYPAARRILGEGELVDHAIDEHDELKRVLADLDGAAPDDDRFTAGFREAERLVTDHVAEEERDLLPRLKNEGDPHQLQKLGQALELAKKAAPTHPHPHAPSTPPGNLVLGPLMGIVDKVRDAAESALTKR